MINKETSGPEIHPEGKSKKSRSRRDDPFYYNKHFMNKGQMPRKEMVWKL